MSEIIIITFLFSLFLVLTDFLIIKLGYKGDSFLLAGAIYASILSFLYFYPKLDWSAINICFFCSVTWFAAGLTKNESNH